jgi:hypothetical protein
MIKMVCADGHDYEGYDTSVPCPLCNAQGCAVVNDDSDFEPDFDGETYDPAIDKPRLQIQLEAVRALMRDGKWRTLSEILAGIGGVGSEGGVGARLRDLRKTKFGGLDIERRRRAEAEGLWEYRYDPQGSPSSNPGTSSKTPTRAEFQAFLNTIEACCENAFVTEGERKVLAWLRTKAGTEVESTPSVFDEFL